MLINPPFKYPKFEMKDLHKKVGVLAYMEPTESDIAEGDFMAQLWLRDMEYNMYLIWERDIREPTKPEGEE